MVTVRIGRNQTARIDDPQNLVVGEIGDDQETIDVAAVARKTTTVVAALDMHDTVPALFGQIEVAVIGWSA